MGSGDSKEAEAGDHAAPSGGAQAAEAGRKEEPAKACCGESAAKASDAKGAEPTSKDSADVLFSRKEFVHQGREPIQDLYVLDKKTLGEGCFGSVCKGTHKSTKAVRAVKTIPKKKLKDEAVFQAEVDFMKGLDHPNIAKVYETFRDAKYVYLVMELCEGGELFDRITEAGNFSENDCAVLMKQILAGIYYCHSHWICHRDLKPENFIFGNKAPDAPLKIIDFGLARSFKGGKPLTTKVGTPYYVAPEVLNGRYDEKCDTWSCGVIMYILLCGYPPFYGDTDKEILNAVKSGKFDFPDEEWSHVSNEAKDLIGNLLAKATGGPKTRLSATEAFNHRWVQEHVKSGGDINKEQGDKIMKRINKFKNANKMKKIAMTVVAQNLPDKDIDQLKATFIALDENGDGSLTSSEIRAGMNKQGVDIPANLEEIMKQVDSDGSGVIDYTEWIAATMQKRMYLKQDVCWCAFRVFDLDGDGKITSEELRSVLSCDDHAETRDDLKQMIGAKDIEAMLGEFDTNNDGVIDFDEFMEMMNKT